jgi:hypothetical protein
VSGAAFGQFIEFLDHSRRIDHDPGADDARDPWRENAAGE